MTKKTETQSIVIPYTPRPLQAEIHAALYNDGKRIRFACLAIHRRFGKTVCAINELIAGALTCPLDRPRFHYIAPTYKQAKSIAWDYLKEFTRVIPRMRYMETELRADFPNGARIQLVGAENYEAMRGQYSDGSVLDEWGNMSNNVWIEVLRPALSDRKGWCIFMGTPNGKNHFYHTYREAEKTEGWLARTYSADETKLIDDEELAMARATMGDDKYRQEFLCDWSASVLGNYYGTEMGRVRAEGRLCHVPHEPLLPVYLAFDLGMDDYTAVWFLQFHNREIRCIRFMQWKDTGVIDVLNEIQNTYRQYDIHQLWMPHDVEVREQVSGRSRKQSLEDLGYVVEAAKRESIADGIQSCRILLAKTWFDKTHAIDGVDCMENYRKKMDARTNTFLEKPEHDEFSHGADAFRTMAYLYYEEMGKGDPTYKARERYLMNTSIAPKTKRVKRMGYR